MRIPSYYRARAVVAYCTAQGTLLDLVPLHRYTISSARALGVAGVGARVQHGSTSQEPGHGSCDAWTLSLSLVGCNRQRQQPIPWSAYVSSRPDKARRPAELRSVVSDRRPRRLVHSGERWVTCDHFSVHSCDRGTVWVHRRMGWLAHTQGS